MEISMPGEEINEKHFRPYYPIRNLEKVHNNYDFLISNDETVIYKKNNHSNHAFTQTLSNPKSLKIFEEILDGSCFNPAIQQHIVNGFDLEPDGSYKSKFIHSFRLDLIESYAIQDEVLQTILTQCQVLIANLEKTAFCGELYGDWALHNLVFSFEFQRIMNIDLEGFLIYNPLPEWANFSVIKGWMNDFQIKLQLLGAESE